MPKISFRCTGSPYWMLFSTTLEANLCLGCRVSEDVDASFHALLDLLGELNNVLTDNLNDLGAIFRFAVLNDVLCNLRKQELTSTGEVWQARG